MHAWDLQPRPLANHAVVGLLEQQRGELPGAFLPLEQALLLGLLPRTTIFGELAGNWLGRERTVEGGGPECAELGAEELLPKTPDVHDKLREGMEDVSRENY